MPFSFSPLDYAQQSALRSAVGFGVGTTILGQDVGDALVSSGRGFVAGTVGGFAARSTGKLHLGGDINSLTQLGFHAVIGGGMGAILNGDWESGAIGGVAAEAMAKLMGSDPRGAASRLVAQARREGLSYEDLYALQQLELQRTSAVSQFTGAVTAYLLGRDVGIAATTGLNAVENNYRGEHQDALDAAWNGAGREERSGFLEEEDLFRLHTLEEQVPERTLQRLREETTREEDQTGSTLRRLAARREASQAYERADRLAETPSTTDAIEGARYLAHLTRPTGRAWDVAEDFLDRTAQSLRSIKETIRRVSPHRQQEIQELRRRVQEAKSTFEAEYYQTELEHKLELLGGTKSLVDVPLVFVPETSGEIVFAGATFGVGAAATGGARGGASLIRGTGQVGRTFLKEAGSVSRNILGEVRQSRMAQSIERFFVGSEPRLEDVLRPIGRFQSDGTVIPFTSAELESLLPKVGISSRAQMGEMLLYDSRKNILQESQTPLALLPAPKTVQHHIFNKFRGQSEKSQKYREFFKKHEIDVDLYSIEITDSMHRRVIHVENNNWTTRWRQWIDINSEATTKEVYQFSGQLMDDYGVSHVPILRYTR